MMVMMCVRVFKTSVEKFMQQCAPILRKNDYSIILYNKVSSERSQFFFLLDDVFGGQGKLLKSSIHFFLNETGI